MVYLSQSVYIRALSIELIHGGDGSDTDLSVLTGTSGMVAAVGHGPDRRGLSDHFGHRRMLGVSVGLIAAFLVAFDLSQSRWTHGTVRAGLTTWYTLDPLLSVAAMPVLMAICRPGVEGSQFTAYMAFVNFCDVIGSFVAGEALRWASAPTIGLACGAAVAGSLAAVWAGTWPGTGLRRGDGGSGR